LTKKSKIHAGSACYLNTDLREVEGMAFKITVCCCHNVISEGIKELLKIIKLDVNVYIRCYGFKEIIKVKPDLVIADFNTLSRRFNDISLDHDIKILLLEAECLPMIENKFFLDFISKGLVGILSADTNRSQLQKAIKSIISGELWFDRNKYRDIVTIANDISTRKNALLTRREIEIVKMICMGYSNKDIKKYLNTTEHSVKSHLTRIFKKTGVTDRLQLAVLAIKTNQFKLHQILQK
jgi:two-component system, NarL family, response regulator DegU